MVAEKIDRYVIDPHIISTVCEYTDNVVLETQKLSVFCPLYALILFFVLTGMRSGGISFRRAVPEMPYNDNLRTEK